MRNSIFPSIPIETVKAARAVFGRSNFYLAVGDRTNLLFDETILEDLSSQYQRTAQTLATLELITVFQFVETLPDPQAAEALRKRVDWKYALHLPLNSPGIEAETLCEFRKNLLAEDAARRSLGVLLSRLAGISHPTQVQLRGVQPDQVVTSVCRFSRLTRIWETFNRSMEALAIHNPEWLLKSALPHWYDRYGTNHKNVDLSIDPQEMETLAQAVGADGRYLLEMVSLPCNQELARLKEIQHLRKTWRDEFEGLDNPIWREKGCEACSQLNWHRNR